MQGNILDTMPKDPLVESIQLVLKDLADVDELFQAVDRKEQELTVLRQHFGETVSREHAIVQDFCRDAVQQVDIQFGNYYSVLETLRSYGQDFDKSILQTEMRRIGEAAINLNLAFMRFRNDALVARGPSSHGGINLLINTIQRFQYGENVVSELQQNSFMEMNLARSSLHSLNSLESSFFTEGLKLFYGNYLEVLQNFDGYFQTSSPELLASLLKELEGVGEQYSRIDINYLVRAYSGGPTSLPIVNMVVNTGKNLAQGTGEREVFQYFLDELWQLVNATRFRYEEIARTVDPEAEAESKAEQEAEVLGESLDIICEALDGFETYLTNNDPAVFKENEEKLLASTEMFAQAVANLNSIVEDSGTVICFRCGTKNSKGGMVCSNCRTLLPLVEEDDSSTSTINTVLDDHDGFGGEPSEPQMTANLSELFEAATAFARQAITGEEFTAVLDMAEDRLKEARKMVKDVPPVTPEMSKDMGEEKAREVHGIMVEAAQVYKSGLESFSTGLVLFREFSSNTTPALLERAREQVWQGAGQLQQAQRMMEAVTR